MSNKILRVGEGLDMLVFGSTTLGEGHMPAMSPPDLLLYATAYGCQGKKCPLGHSMSNQPRISLDLSDFFFNFRE